MLALALSGVLSLVAVTNAAPAEPAPQQPAGTTQPVQEGERPQGGEPGQQGQAGRERRGPSVEGAMKIMDRNLGFLQANISDPSKKEENLGFINETQRGCIMAKGLPVPKQLLEQAGDEAAQTKLKQVYHAEMLALLKKLILLEDAVAEGKLDTANTLLNEVFADRDRGHNAMNMHEEKPFWQK